MSIITISRGVFSGGEALAECVAGRLGYRCIDRDTLVERTAAAGVPESELLEALLKSPGLLDRIRRRRQLYLMLIRAFLAEEVADGETVYHGTAGHFLLMGSVPILRVRVIAPPEFRLPLVRERTGLEPAEGALYLAQHDEERRKWARFLYDVEWGDPSLYDVVVNLEHASIAEACDAVTTMARLDCFAMTPERRAALKDFALSSRVRAALGLDPGTARLEVEVWCQSGIVHIQGFVGSHRGLREVERVAAQVPGIRHLDLEHLTIYHNI